MSNFKIELRIPCCSKIIKTYFNLILSQLALKCIQKFFPGLIFSHRTRKIKRIFPHFFLNLRQKRFVFDARKFNFVKNGRFLKLTIYMMLLWNYLDAQQLRVGYQTMRQGFCLAPSFLGSTKPFARTQYFLWNSKLFSIFSMFWYENAKNDRFSHLLVTLFWQNLASNLFAENLIF